MKRLLPILMFWLVTTAQAAMPQIELAIGKHVLTAEVAHTDPDRMQGLMNRRMLPENRGMLRRVAFLLEVEEPAAARGSNKEEETK